MKTIVLWAFLLGTVRCGDYSESFKCAGDPKDIKFTLKRCRNQTGHWQAQVQLERTDVEEDEAAWNVDIDRTFTFPYDGSGSVLLVATIPVPPEGNAAVKPQRQKCIPEGNAVVKTQPKKSVPEGYRKFSENHYFKRHTVPAVWVDAFDVCEKEGAHLAVINSVAEGRFVAAMWTFKSEWAYIGAHDLYIERNYVTIYNETLRDIKWNGGDPHQTPGENCLGINRKILYADFFCTDYLPFFCELEY